MLCKNNFPHLFYMKGLKSGPFYSEFGHKVYVKTISKMHTLFF
jgi:hypothetical protein